jgi:hypothetical protein
VQSAKNAPAASGGKLGGARGGVNPKKATLMSQICIFLNYYFKIALVLEIISKKAAHDAHAQPISMGAGRNLP